MTDLAGVGAALIGFAAVITSGAAWYNAFKNTKKIDAIDHAVNGKPPGAQSMQSQVDDIHSDRPAPPELPPRDARRGDSGHAEASRGRPARTPQQVTCPAAGRSCG